MGASKIDGFTPAQLHLAKYAHALGHPARIAILQFLAQRRRCLCGDIVDGLPLSQATISQHLKALRQAGLIKGDNDGPSVHYSIDEKIWNRARMALGNLFLHCTPMERHETSAVVMHSPD
jgi:DNA-binding transcriptional ArsR family regulator